MCGRAIKKVHGKLRVVRHGPVGTSSSDVYPGDCHFTTAEAILKHGVDPGMFLRPSPARSGVDEEVIWPDTPGRQPAILEGGGDAPSEISELARVGLDLIEPVVVTSYQGSAEVVAPVGIDADRRPRDFHSENCCYHPLDLSNERAQLLGSRDEAPSYLDDERVVADGDLADTVDASQPLRYHVGTADRVAVMHERLVPVPRITQGIFARGADLLAELQSNGGRSLDVTLLDTDGDTGRDHRRLLSVEDVSLMCVTTHYYYLPQEVLSN